MQKDVREGIEHDLRNVVKCRFDRLLKYFLYLVLKKDSEEKKKLDELQRKIEELQSERYHTYENVGREDKMSDDMPQEQPVVLVRFPCLLDTSSLWTSISYCLLSVSLSHSSVFYTMPDYCIYF